MNTVESYVDLVRTVAGLYNKEISVEKVNISSKFVCTVEVKGHNWDGYIDTRIANFVIELQKNFNKLYKKIYTEEALSKKINKVVKPRIKIKVYEGSSLVEISTGDLLQELIKNMSGEQTLYLFIILIVSMSVVFLGNKAISSFQDVRKHAKDEETKQEIARQFGKVLQHEREINAPLISLAKSMLQDDRMVLKGKEFSKDEAKKHFSVPEKSRLDTYFIDDRYEISLAHLKNHGIRLEKAGKNIFASTKLLRNEARKELYSHVEDAGANEKIPKIDLRVNVAVKDDSHEAFVIELGPKRGDSITLQELLALIHDLELPRDDGQLSLLNFSKGG